MMPSLSDDADARLTELFLRYPPDLTIVGALVRGVTPERKPRRSERVKAIAHLAGFGYSDAQIGRLIGRSQRSVHRARATYGIEGLPVGTNALTRPRNDV